MAWTRGHTIGRGSTATVSLAAATTTGDLMAVKSANLSSSEPLKREEQIMSQLDSPYIVKCLGSDTTYEQNKEPTHNLFLEFIPGQTLHDLTASRGGSLDEDSIRFFSNQILKGLNYLHDKGVAHCDIKGHNVLVGSNGIVKITDFGCAVVKRASPDGNHRNRHATPVIYGGTPAYMSPEVARGEGQGFAADIWALGCTIIEMATGHGPWRDSKDPVSALYRIGYSDDVPETPTWFSDSAKDFVSMCLVRDPNERWSAKELLSHCFFDSLVVNCNGIDEFTTKISPTSVIDRGVWDDTKGSSSSCSVQDSMDLVSGFGCSDDGIMGLVRGCHGVCLDWEEDGDGWVNVRGVSEVEDDVINRENLCVEDDDHDELNEEAAAAVLFLSLDEDEICVHGDLLIDSFNDVIISVGDGNNVLRDEFVSRMFVILERILIEFSFYVKPSFQIFFFPFHLFEIA